MARKKKNRLLTYILRKRFIPSKNRRRVGQTLILLTVFVFCLFLVNFAVIIGTDSKFGVDLSEAAKKVHQTEVTVQAKRGTIYDRTGKPIAEDSTTYTVYAIIDTSYVSALKEVLYVQASQFSKVAEIFEKNLGMEKDYVLQQLNMNNLKQVYFGTLGKNISYSTMTTIQEEMETAGIKGISFSASPGRLYPEGDFASNFIGLANPVENKDGSYSLSGAMGMEYYLNDILSGQDGKIIYEKDSAGRIYPGTENVQVKAVDGKDVYTTISADLQRSLETNMDVFFEETSGKYASATLVAAKTGEILATTQRPSYNPDTKEGMDNEDLLNYSLLYQANFEPGSTMKVMTLASAIDNGTFDPNQTYYNDQYVIADATIKDWEVNAGGSAKIMTMAQGFAFSSNIGMTMLEQQMGDETWLNYLNKFRFGYPTRFGMGDETGGLLPGDNIVTIAMSSFGQGISVTQTQMLRAFSAIANNGVMIQPKYISAVYDPNTASVRVGEPEEMGKPVSEEAADQTLNYMVTVGTDPYFGTLYAPSLAQPVINVDGYNIAVKSGTAQIAKDDGTGYMSGSHDTINSIVAMIPAEDPEFIMYVTVQQPQTFNGIHWRDIVTPSLKEAMLLKDSLSLTEPAVQLTSIGQETEYVLEDIIGHSPGATAEELRRQLVQPIILGNGSEITKVSVKTGSNLAANQQILLLTDNFTTLPDLYGWTQENVDVFAKWTGIEIVYKGSGSKVAKQSVEIGKKLDSIKKITITLGE
ncbi:TPA: penicillin-binding protein PBP2X [Streptococcus suis]